jgi:hypothetical protein
MSAVLLCRTSYGISCDLSANQELKMQQILPGSKGLNGVPYTIITHRSTMGTNSLVWYTLSILIEINEQQLTAIEISSGDISTFLNKLIHDIVDVDCKMINPAFCIVSSYRSLQEASNEIQSNSRY